MAGWRDRAVKVEAEPSAPAKSSWRERATPIETPVEPDEPVALSRAAEPPKERVPEDPGLARTIGSGLLEGFFKGGSDELMGGVTSAAKDPESGMAWTQPDGKPKFLKTEGDIYRAGRDSEREIQKGGFEHRPKTLIASQIAGDIGSDALMKMILPNLPVGSKAYQTAMGALTGFLSGDAELTGPEPEYGKAAIQTGIGGGLGAAVPYAAKWGGKALAKAGPGMKKFAEERAAKALGRDWKKVLESYGPRRLREIGRDMLDNGVVTFGSSSETAGKRLEGLTKDRGDFLGGIIDTLDDATPAGERLDVAGLVERLRAKLTRDVAPANRGAADVVAGELDDVSQMAVPFADRAAREGADIAYKPTLSIKEGEELLKRPYQAKAKSGQAIGTPGSTRDGLQEMARAIKQAIEEHADDVARKHAPDMVGDFKAAKSAYGKAAEAMSVAGKQGDRDLINNFVTPTDYGAAITGATAAGADLATGGISGAAAAIGHHLLKKRGSSAVAVGSDALAKGADKLKLRQAGIALQKYGPKMGSYLVREILRDDPDLLNMFEAEQEGQLP